MQIVAQAPGRRADGRTSTRVQRAHVQQTFAGERAFFEQVLIDLRRRHAVRIDAALAGEQPVKRRDLSRHRQRCRDARLQDAVAGDDAAPRHVDMRPVHRMRGDRRRDRAARPGGSSVSLSSVSTYARVRRGSLIARRGR